MLQSEREEDRADLVAQVVEEYFERARRGEQPRLEEFLERYPEISDLLRTVIPGLQAAEQPPEAAAQGDVEHQRHKRLGDFRILRQIGRGGMGIVYEAEQISMNRRVALKVLPLAGLVDELKIRRFRNEVRAVAALDHPNIVSVYMVGEERGVHYYAMQLIRGRSLSDVIASLRHVQNDGQPLDGSTFSQVTSQGAIESEAESGVDATVAAEVVAEESRSEPSAETIDAFAKTTNRSSIPNSTHREYFRSVASLGIQAATALQHAHDQGIVHRDIKPANLLLDSAAKLYVTDFGLARIESDVGVTMTGDLIGTLRYMAPEQALAKRVNVDHRADIYSLGVTLYELLTLRPAYVAEDRQQLLKQIAFEDPPRLRRIDRDIPAELETIIHKAMSKDMDQRYASAQELADDLRSHLENRPIKAKPPTVSEIVGKWTRRNPALTWSAIITLTLVTVTLATSIIVIAKQLARTSTAEQKSRQANEEAVRRADELAHRNYLLHISSADTAIQTRSYERARVELDACNPEHQQRWEWQYLDQQLRSTFSIPFPRGIAHVTRDGKQLIWIGGPTSNFDYVRIWDLNSREVVRELSNESQSPLMSLAVSNDEHWVACGDRDGDLVVWSVETGEERWRVDTNDDQRRQNRVRTMAFSPDNQRLVAAYDDRRMLVQFDVMTGTEVKELGPFKDSPGNILFSPDGRWITSGLKNANMPDTLIDAETFEIATILDDEIHPGSVVFSPDSRWMAAVTQNGDGPAALIDVASGKIAAKFSEESGDIRPTFDSSGRRIATATADGWIRVWNWDEEQLDEVVSMRASKRELAYMTFNADGSCLASIDHAATVKVWDTATGEFLASLESTSRVDPVVFRSSEGESQQDELMIRNNSSEIRFWRWRTSQTGTTVKPLNGAAEAHFSPDGQLILVSTPMWFMGATLYYTRHHFFPPEPAAILNAPSGLRIKTIDEAIYAATWSPNGSEVIAMPAAGNAIRTYDVATGKRTSRKFAGHSGRFTISQASSDGEQLISFSSDNTIRVFDYTSGEEVSEARRVGWGSDIYTGVAADFSSGAHLIWLGDAGFVSEGGGIWDTHSARRVSKHPLSGRFATCVVFSDDGKHVYVGGNDGLLAKINIETNTKATQFFGHKAYIGAIALSPKERHIVSGNSLGQVIVWDVASGQPLVTLVTGGVRITSLDWGPDGRRIVAGKEDGTVQIWSLPVSR